MYVHMGLMHGAVQQERTQHCEAIMLKNETAMGVSRGGKRKSKGGQGEGIHALFKNRHVRVSLQAGVTACNGCS